MENGTLIDPLTGDESICKIGNGNRKTTEVYHVPLAFNLVERVGKRKRHPFIVITDNATHLLWATSAEHYTKRFHKIRVKRLNPLQYIEHIEELTNEQ